MNSRGFQKNLKSRMSLSVEAERTSVDVSQYLHIYAALRVGLQYVLNGSTSPLKCGIELRFKSFLDLKSDRSTRDVARSKTVWSSKFCPGNGTE